MKKKFTKKTGMCVAVIIGAIIIPLLYSYFYLGAFWDPYSKLDNIPVAVVNNDAGYTINGEERNIGDEITDKLKADGTFDFVFTDEADAKDGTAGNKYYAMIVIPNNFSQDIASATTTDKQSAVIKYSANQKRNYLASQILNTAIIKIEASTRESVNEEIVAELADQLNSVPDQLTKMQDGINQISSGSTQLNSGTIFFSTSFTKFKTGLIQAKAGSTSLNTGIKTLNSGATALASGTLTFDTNLNQFTGGVSQLISNTVGTKNYLTNYLATHSSISTDYPELAGFITSLSSASNTTSLATLQASIAPINSGSLGIKIAASNLSAGAGQLVTGSNSLDSGITELNSGATQLDQGAKDLASGSEELNNGIGELKTSVDTSITDANNQLTALDGLAEYTKTSVVVDEDNVVDVPNYGTAFAPYFLSLSLWVGGIIIYMGIYFDPDNRFKVLSRNSQKRSVRSFAYLLIGLAQAFILGLILIFALDLKVDNLPLFFLSSCLVSVVFVSIIQFFMVVFKDLGKFLTMLLLILQLTSCGGTFPIETLPVMFRVMYAFMPMTYSVGLFKESISGVVVGNTLYNAGILFGMLVVFMTLTIVCSRRNLKKEMKGIVLK